MHTTSNPETWPAPGAPLTLVCGPHPMPENLDADGFIIDPSEDLQIVVRGAPGGRFWTLGFAFRNEAQAYAIAVALTHKAPYPTDLEPVYPLLS